MMKVYRFVLFSYATELTRLVSVSVGLVVLGLGLITVFFGFGLSLGFGLALSGLGLGLVYVLVSLTNPRLGLASVRSALLWRLGLWVTALCTSTTLSYVGPG